MALVWFGTLTGSSSSLPLPSMWGFPLQVIYGCTRRMLSGRNIAGPQRWLGQQELALRILVGPFQLGIFYDFVIL